MSEASLGIFLHDSSCELAFELLWSGFFLHFILELIGQGVVVCQQFRDLSAAKVLQH